MDSRKLTYSIVATLLLSSAAVADPGDRVELRLDDRGDRIENRLVKKGVRSDQRRV